MMWENPYVGVSVPRNIRGRGTGITLDERVEEVQVLWTPDPRRAERDNKVDDLKLLEALRPQVVAHPPTEVELGDEKDLEGKELHEWQRIQEARLVPVGTRSTPTAHSLEAVRVEPAAASAPEQAPEPSTFSLGPADGDRFAGYGPERNRAVGRIEAGDLVQIDDALDLWAVVEAVDFDGDDVVCIAWRDDEGAAGDLAMSDTDSLLTRRPISEDDD